MRKTRVFPGNYSLGLSRANIRFDINSNDFANPVGSNCRCLISRKFDDFLRIVVNQISVSRTIKERRARSTRFRVFTARANDESAIGMDLVTGMDLWRSVKASNSTLVLLDRALQSDTWTFTADTIFDTLLRKFENRYAIKNRRIAYQSHRPLNESTLMNIALGQSCAISLRLCLGYLLLKALYFIFLLRLYVGGAFLAFEFV